MTNRAGQLPYDARDAFLEGLCSFCLTPVTTQGQEPRQSMGATTFIPQKTTQDYILTEKNIQICKTLLNIAHCLGYLLDVRSWYIILDTMQRIEAVIKNAKNKRLGGGMINRTAPTINQATGAQTLVEFNDVKQRVQDKLKEYNLLSRPSNSLAMSEHLSDTREEEK